MPHYDKKKIIIFLILAAIAIVSIYKIISVMHDRNKAAKLKEETVNEYVDKITDEGAVKDVVNPWEVEKDTSAEAEPIEEDDPNGWYHLIEVDIEGLQAVNPDVIGWIYFENEESISYPVLYSGDDEEYLRKTYTGEEITAGSIFLEGVNKPDLSDAHTLIYGHNMKDLSMFGKLKFFKNEPDYYENHRYFQVITKDKVYRYQIFAYEDNNQLTGGVYSVYNKPLDDFYEFLEDTICNRSLVNCDINVRDYDHVVTLSTCSAAGSDYRFSVSAVRVDEHNRIPGYVKEEQLSTEISDVDSSDESIVETTEEATENNVETYVTTARLSLRRTAGTDAEKIMTIPSGDVVEYQNDYSEVDGIKWLKVKYKGQEGYCSSEYLEKKESVTVPSKTYYTTTEGLSLRKNAGTDGARLAIISSGETVEYQDESLEVDGIMWFKVSYQGKIGYCASEYLEINNTP